MRLSGLGTVVAGAAIMVGAGCSGGGTGAATATTAPPVSTGASASTQPSVPIPDVKAQLLQLSDLPIGWSTSASSNSTSSLKCLQNARSYTKQDKAKAEADFQGGSNGVPFFEEGIGFLPGVAKAAMTTFATAMAGCGQISLSDNGHTFKGTIGQMSFPTLGAQTLAYQMNLSTTASGLTITIGFDFAAVRFANDELALLAYGDVGTPDITQVQDLFQKAAAKVGA